jgi:hypothetical protein
MENFFFDSPHHSTTDSQPRSCKNVKRKITLRCGDDGWACFGLGGIEKD